MSATIILVAKPFHCADTLVMLAKYCSVGEPSLYYNLTKLSIDEVMMECLCDVCTCSFSAVIYISMESFDVQVSAERQ